jgi:uroporphyrinogen decarboxylase
LDKVLQDIKIDAAIFNEPIGGNEGPIISPAMYELFVLNSYKPILEILDKYGIETIIFRTYANMRLLIPSILEYGFNCLWACETDSSAMDYRDIRNEFGRALRLIGGIDLDTLRYDKSRIHKELVEKVPPLISGGGYVPLADGRVRKDIPYENYAYYRRLLEQIIRNELGGNLHSFSS